MINWGRVRLFALPLNELKLKLGSSPDGARMSDAGEKHSRFKVVLDFLKKLLGRKPTPPGDPYAYSMAPLLRGPKGRSGAAVAEIEEDSYRSFPPRCD